MNDEKFNKIIGHFYNGDMSIFRGESAQLSLEEAKKFFKWIERNFPTDRYAILPILQELFNYKL